jgi:predicted protein tyrosine phosphatase
MFDLKICGIIEAELWSQNQWPTHIITLNGSPPTSSCNNHLVLKMHDIVKKTESYQILPSAEHLDEIFKFSKNLTDNDRLLIHCNQGISRSPAIAIGILIQHGLDYQSAYNRVKQIRNIFPNKLIIKMLDEKFNLNFQLINLVSSN